MKRNYQTFAAETDEAERLVKQAIVWCGINGLMYTDGILNWSPAPISLVPNAFPRSSFEFARDIQTSINTLVDGIARDRTFIIKELSKVSDSDEFTKTLLEIYKTIPEAIVKDSIQFGIIRSDYMIDSDGSPLQVEINTIASSFGCLSYKVSEFHRQLLERNKGDEAVDFLLNESISPYELKPDSEVLYNPSLKLLPAGLAKAHEAFNDPEAVVVFVVQPNEKNVADQRLLEGALWTNHKIPAEFMSLLDFNKNARIDQKTKNLIIKPTDGGVEKVVSVVYYRAGYSPNDYSSEKEWDARRLIEGTNAIKCPNIGYQLAGTKAIQAALCRPGILERYITTEQANELRKSFAAQYSLSDPAVEKEAKIALKEAAEDGTKWVLKPQREGGGNNFYGETLSKFLKTHENDSVLGGYVLMQRIFPASAKTAFLRKGKLLILPSISELGIYGTFISNGKKEILNEFAGQLLRTKPFGVDEGGVAAGFSVLNSFILVD